MNTDIAKALHSILTNLDIKAGSIPSIDELKSKGLPECVLRDALDEIKSLNDAQEWCNQYR